jgi:hypothetical protein
MEFDGTTTLGIFVALIVVGAGGLLASGVMAVGTILMMVLPAMIVFGLVCLAIGVQYGEYRAT